MQTINNTADQFTANLLDNVFGGVTNIENAYHVGEVWGGYPELKDNSKLVHHTGGKLPLIISEFKDGQGRDYVAVVNNSQSESDQAIICWRGKPEIYHVVWQAKETSAHAYVRDEADRGKPTDEIMTGPWLAPGQMELYRVEQATEV